MTAADDDDAVDDSAILTHTATGGDYTTGSAAGNNVTAELSVTVDDNDTAGITFNPPRTVTVNEGANETYTIVLDTEPTADVTITIDDPSRTIDYDSDISVSPSVLTFTPTNWRTPQTSNSEYRRGDDDDDGYMETFSHTAEGGDYNTRSGNVVTADLTVM